MKKLLFLLCSLFPLANLGYKTSLDLLLHSPCEIEKANIYNATQIPFFVTYTDTKNRRQVTIINPDERLNINAKIKGSNSLVITNPEQEISFQLSENEHNLSLSENYGPRLWTDFLQESSGLIKAYIKIRPYRSSNSPFGSPFNLLVKYSR